MTTILLMRHAKAAKPASGMSDFDRPLEMSGRTDAAKVGKRLLGRWGKPDRVLCSSAKRTRETLAAMDLGVEDAHVRFDEALFSGEALAYLEALRQESGALLLLIGHNPSIQEAALALAGSGGDAGAGKALAGAFPTGGVAVLNLSGPATGARPGRGVLEAFIAPDDIPAA